jgi:hypothetical protein
VNPEMIDALPHLVNKTIAHVVLKEGVGPPAQLFLVFTDGTYYEFYSNGHEIHGAARTYGGGLPAALHYGGQEIVFQC